MKTTNGTIYPQPPYGAAPGTFFAQPPAPVGLCQEIAGASRAPMPFVPNGGAVPAGTMPVPGMGAVPVPQKPSTETERWIGGTVLCVLAALLILGGLVLLCDYLLKAQPAVSFFMLVLYCIAVGVLGVALALKSSVVKSNQRIKALVAFVTAEFMLFIVASESAWAYSGDVALLIYMGTFIALRFMAAPRVLVESQVALRVNELVVLFCTAIGFVLIGIAGGAQNLVSLILLGVASAGAAVLVGSRAFNLMKSAENRPVAAFPVLYAAAFIGVFLGYVFDTAAIFSSSYVWSALCLACALVCVAAGFWFREKPLRIFGLTVALLCVAKIVLLDVSGDMLVRAIALVLGGLACFGISMLYLFASKRLGS